MHGPAIGDLVLLLAISVPAALLFRRLHLPLLAGYLLVGILVGPHALKLVGDVEAVETLAEVGVILLLFAVGLEFSLPRLLLQGRRLLFSGAGQMTTTIAAVAGLAMLADVPWRTALVLGFLGAMSSTAFVLKTLADARQLEAPHGRLSVGILLFQDLCVILLMVGVSLLAEGSAGPGAVALALGESVLGVAAVVLISRYGFPRLAEMVVRTGGRELFVLFVGLVVLGAAWVANLAGLSVALGAFVAGLFISESEYSHQAVSEILPFRDVFNAMFFISVGMLFDPDLVANDLGLVGGLAAGLVGLKALLAGPVVAAVTRSARLGLLCGIGLAQVGEFSLVLAQVGRDEGLLPEDWMGHILAVATITMVASPFLMRAAPWVADRLGFRGEGAHEPAAERGSGAPRVVVVGYGLVGSSVGRVLRAAAIPFQVVDINVDHVISARAEGLPAIFGDGSRPETLERAGLERAAILVLTMPDPGACRRAVVAARHVAPDVHLVVRTRFASEQAELQRLGADHVIPEEFETSIEIFSSVLEELGVPRGNIALQAEMIRRENYRLLRTGTVEPDGISDVAALRALLALTSVDTFLVEADSPVAGYTLAELELRERTGANVVFAVREERSVHNPGGDFLLEPGELLVVLGSSEQVQRCRRVLAGLPAVEPPESAPLDEEPRVAAGADG